MPKSPGVTIDTGFLIALQRWEFRAWDVKRSCAERGLVLTVPSVVLVEWWHGTGARHRILRGMEIDSLSESVALTAGEALGAVSDEPSVVDAVVMASAARRGDMVFTSDVADMELLRTFFPAVKVMSWKR